MAKAQFHKNQRVYVRPVGTWALVERIIPQWTKGLDEPIRVFYDVGMGRDFSAEELQAEKAIDGLSGDAEVWRVMRSRNKWQSPEETANHPFPGTYPVVVTGEAEWGGWRVPSAEYTLSPTRIERQARMIACAPRLLTIVQHITEWARRAPSQVPDELLELMRQGHQVVVYVNDGTGE
jgi:hypothetical protein